MTDPSKRGIHLTINDDHARQRVDVLLTRELPGYARAAIHKLFNEDLVHINGEVVKSGYKVRAGDILTADTSPLLTEPDAIDLPILFENEDVVVLDKPAGILTHTNSPYRREASVASYIRALVANELGGDRGGIVHRLDRKTSGVIVCAKNQASLSWLQKQFSQRNVKKTYIAVVSGRLTHREAIIDAPIARNAAKPKTFHVDPAGKSAQTHYTVIAEQEGMSAVKLEPVTGRTHQLRVHLAYLGHPIAGDDLYGHSPADRLLLHAHTLEITLPNRQRVTFTAELPSDFPAFVHKALHA